MTNTTKKPAREYVQEVVDTLRGGTDAPVAEQRAVVQAAIDSLPRGFGELEAALQLHAHTLEGGSGVPGDSPADVADEIERLSQGL
jgi:hypothetical protein